MNKHYSPIISIIVPVYNTCNYLDKCLNSILSQKFKDFEIILIDDGSQDNSLEICKRYATADHRIKLFTKKNEGIAKTRRFGIEKIKGQYVIQVDSDDWVEYDYLYCLYHELIEKDADIVYCSFINEAGNSSSILSQPKISTNVDGIKLLLNGELHGSLCNKLIKVSMLDNINMPIGNVYEDLAICIQCFYTANRISYIDIPLYHYLVNNNSISRNTQNLVSLSKKIEDAKNNITLIEDFLEEKSLLDKYQNELLIRKARVKNYIYDLMYNSYQDFYSTYPEANNSLAKLKYVPKKVKLLQQLLLRTRI